MRLSGGRPGLREADLPPITASTGTPSAGCSPPRTRLVVLNFPHNPSGRGPRPHGISPRWRRASGPTRALVLSDEVYEHIVFDGSDAPVA
ncbi:MAG: hypothetical protein MZV70_37835 [Desulfobacterales bacterium]|nr:hypothetical protein [Desulfobacterales bacterium]